MIITDTCRLNKFYITLLIFICSFGYVLPQSLTKYENEYLNLTKKINIEYQILDSLNKVYNKEIQKIEFEKKKNSPNQNVIESIMSGAVVISGSINKTQLKIDLYNREIEKKKNYLDKLYTIKIDSLKKLEYDKKYEGNKGTLNLDILSYIEKRLIVKPPVGSLSYNPNELVNIELSSITDEKEKQLYIEYIKAALAETDKQISIIRKESDRLDEMLSLKKKVDDFIDDSDFRTNLARSKQSAQANKSIENSDIDFNYANRENNLLPQVKTFSIILDQLKFSGNISKMDPSKLNQYVNGTNNISLIEYRSLLIEVESRLSKYKTILNIKLKNEDNAR
ncbi:MAG: hypothetical protein KKB34_02030 [Bacteroidetes bacterium]|nr:hypothetical protein [Bacteroidota bacterium]